MTNGFSTINVGPGLRLDPSVRFPPIDLSCESDIYSTWDNEKKSAILARLNDFYSKYDPHHSSIVVAVASHLTVYPNGGWQKFGWKK